MTFNTLSLAVSAVYVGSALALIVLSLVGRTLPDQLFDLSLASLAALGSLFVSPSQRK